MQLVHDFTIEKNEYRSQAFMHMKVYLLQTLFITALNTFLECSKVCRSLDIDSYHKMLNFRHNYPSAYLSDFYSILSSIYVYKSIDSQMTIDNPDIKECKQYLLERGFHDLEFGNDKVIYWGYKWLRFFDDNPIQWAYIDGGYPNFVFHIMNIEYFKKNTESMEHSSRQMQLLALHNFELCQDKTSWELEW